MNEPRPESDRGGELGEEALGKSSIPDPPQDVQKSDAPSGGSGGHPPGTILIVDDHLTYRLGIARLLERQAGLTVLGTCESGVTALSFLREHPCALVILDINLPGPDGIEVLKQIRAEHPSTAVLMHSMHGE